VFQLDFEAGQAVFRGITLTLDLLWALYFNYPRERLLRLFQLVAGPVGGTAFY
jgi:hypothetical protein